MRFVLFFSFLVSLGFFSTGCQTAPMAMNYAPSSLVQGKGTVQVQEFRYVPAEAGKVAPDQIPNTAIGNIHLGQPISGYVTKAFSSELKYAGYSLDSSAEKPKTVLTGEIKEFKADDLGFSVDWTLRLKVDLKDRAGKSSASQDVVIKKNLQKFGEFSVAVNLIIKEAFEQMMAEPGFKKQIR